MPIKRQDRNFNETVGDGYTDFQDIEIGTYLNGIISHVDNPASFYLQFENPDKKKFFFLQQELGGELRSRKNIDINLNMLMKGQCYTTKKGGIWCRVLLESFSSDGMCKIFYLDVGFRQSVHVRNLKYIPNRFLILPPQAVLCKLYGINLSSEVDTMVPVKSLLNHTVTIFVEKVYVGQVGRFLEGESALHVTAYLNNELVSINTKLVLGGYKSQVEQHEQSWHLEVLSSCRTPASPRSFDSMSTASENFADENNLSNFPITSASHWIVSVSHIDDPGQFFIHFQHAEDKLKKLRELLSNPRVAFPRTDTIETGNIYAVRTENGEPWHRGKCIGRCGFVFQSGVAESCYEFLLIDHGSKTKIATSCIRQLPKQYLEFPSFAVECSLGLKCPIGGWKSSVIEQFQALAYHRPLRMTVTEVTQCALIVDLAEVAHSSHGEMMEPFKKLLKGPHVSRVSLRPGQFRHKWINQPKGTQLMGRVLSVCHPCAFYVRFLDSVHDSFPAFQRELQEELEPTLGAEWNLCAPTPCPGTAYAIRHNGSWHRVLLEEVNPTNGHARIFFVDNGMRVSVAPYKLRKLPERFTEYPAQVMWCKLCNIRPSVGDDWPKTSRQFFREKVHDALVTVYIATTLQGSVGKAGSKEYTYFVYLYTDERKESVNSLLVKHGHAVGMYPLEEPSRLL